jgi:hypothetical protein
MMEKPVTQTANNEQAADLAALEAAAAAAPPQPGDPVPEALPNLAEEVAGMIKVLVATLAPAFPSLNEIYTPETTQAAAGAIGAVCEKHGWLNGGLFGKWGEEIACVAIVGPLAMATYKGVNADLEKARAKEKPKAIENQAAPVTAPGPQSKVVTFGNTIPAEA